MKIILSLCCAMALTSGLFAQTKPASESVFSTIGKNLKDGDAQALSAVFADNLDIEILDVSNICSKNQATQILKNFFAKYTPKNFILIHQSGKDQMQYGIGELAAGGEQFRVTLFLQLKAGKPSIQQIRIEKR